MSINNEKEYKDALKEREKHANLMNDTTMLGEEERAFSSNKVKELDGLIKEYEDVKKNKPEEKSYLEKAMEGSKNTGMKMSAAYTPDLGSSKDASLAGNPDFVEADKKRDEAKMNGTATDVAKAEADVQALYASKAPLKDKPPLKDNDKESLQAQNDIQEAVAETKGSGAPTTPQTVVESLGNKYGFKTTFTPDGKMVPTEESQWKRADLAGKLAMFGTALSCIVSALSGGNIPPINFNKIVGVDKQYTTYLANVHQYNEAISAGAKKSSENQAYSDFGTYLSSLPDKERMAIENIASEYEYTKSIADQERLKTQGKVNEDLINAKQQAGINAMLYMYDKVKKGELPKDAFEQFAQYIRATEGQGVYERGMNLLSQGAGAASDVIGSIRGTGRGKKE